MHRQGRKARCRQAGSQPASRGFLVLSSACQEAPLAAAHLNQTRSALAGLTGSENTKVDPWSVGEFWVTQRSGQRETSGGGLQASGSNRSSLPDPEGLGPRKKGKGRRQARSHMVAQRRARLWKVETLGSGWTTDGPCHAEAGLGEGGSKSGVLPGRVVDPLFLGEAMPHDEVGGQWATRPGEGVVARAIHAIEVLFLTTVSQVGLHFFLSLVPNPTSAVGIYDGPPPSVGEFWRRSEGKNFAAWEGVSLVRERHLSWSFFLCHGLTNSLRAAGEGSSDTPSPRRQHSKWRGARTDRSRP